MARSRTPMTAPNMAEMSSGPRPMSSASPAAAVKPVIAPNLDPAPSGKKYHRNPGSMSRKMQSPQPSMISAATIPPIPSRRFQVSSRPSVSAPMPAARLMIAVTITSIPKRRASSKNAMSRAILCPFKYFVGSVREVSSARLNVYADLEGAGTLLI